MLENKSNIKIYQRIFAFLIFNKYPITLFILLSFAPLLWFHNINYPVGSFDPGIGYSFYNPSYWLRDSYFGWLSSDLGKSTSPYYVPFIFIFLNLFRITKNYLITQEIFFICNFFLSLLFFYFFTQLLFENYKYKKIISSLAAFFYVFNVYTLTFMLLDNSFMFFILAFIPLFLFLFLKSIRTLNYTYIILISFLFSFFSILNSVFVSIFPIIFLAIILFLDEFLKHFEDKIHLKKLIKYLFTMFFVVILVNAWSILYFTFTMFNRYNNVARLGAHILRSIYKMYGNISDLFYLFRNFYYTHNDYIVFMMKKNGVGTWFMTYYNPFFVFIGILISFIIFISIINKIKDLYIFTIIYVLGITLTLGPTFPFRNFKMMVFEHMPLHGIFSDSFYFFTFLTVSESILLSFGLLIIYDFFNIKIKNWLIKLLIFGFVILIGFVYAFPLWGGLLYNSKIKKHGFEISKYVKVPHYYKTASYYFKKDKLSYNIMVFPLIPYTNHLFKWKHGFYGSGLLYLLYNHSEISNVSLDSSPQDNILISMQNDNFRGLAEICGIFSIKYVVVPGDAYYPKYENNFFSMYNAHFFYKFFSKNSILSILNGNNNFKFIKKFGRLSVYKLHKQFYLNRVWTPKNIMILKKVNDLAKNHYKYSYIIPYIVLSPYYKIGTVIIFSRSGNTKTNFFKNQVFKKYYFVINNKSIEVKVTKKKYATPKIEFKEINPTKYITIFYEVKKNIFINLNEMFSPNWKAYPVKYYNKRLWTSSNANTKRYISRDYNGSIQNNNLPSGYIFQTLFQKPLKHKYHFIINGYANGWYIDLNNIKKLGLQYYTVNKDGSINFELILDYWPQRLFYIGLIISGTTTIVFILYLIFDYIRKKYDGKR